MSAGNINFGNQDNKVVGLSILGVFLVFSMIVLSIIGIKLARSQIQYNKESKDKKENHIQSNFSEKETDQEKRKVTDGLNVEIKRYKNRIIESCRVDYVDKRYCAHINQHRRSVLKNDEDFDLKSIKDSNDELDLSEIDVIFCESRFKKAIDQFNDVVELSRDSECDLRAKKAFLDMIKNQTNTQPLFELYNRSHIFNILSVDKEDCNYNGYLSDIRYTHKSIVKLQNVLYLKYGDKILDAICNNEFDKANEYIGIYKLLTYYSTEVKIMISALNGKDSNSTNKEKKFINKYKDILEREYVYGLMSMKFEYIVEARDAEVKKYEAKDNKEYWKYERKSQNIREIVELLDRVLNEITKDPKYKHLKNITQEKFEKLDEKNFAKTKAFIFDNKIVQRIDELFNPPKQNIKLSKDNQKRMSI